MGKLPRDMPMKLPIINNPIVILKKYLFPSGMWNKIEEIIYYTYIDIFVCCDDCEYKCKE